MSYWYERMTKKYVGILLAMLIPLVTMLVAQLLGSYCYGMIATASRTLYDWCAIDQHFSSFEVVPFVHMSMEYGCVEWLGFSTCEAVQFKEWMEIWTSDESLSISIWNVTNTGNTGFSTASPTFSTLSPMSIDRKLVDVGTTSLGGALTLKLRSSSYLTGDAPTGSVTIPNLASMSAYVNGAGTAGLFSTVEVKSLFTEAQGPTYFNLASKYTTYGLSVPAKGTYYKLNVPQAPYDTMYMEKMNRNFGARNGVKNLLYFQSIGNDMERCLVSPTCMAQCTWSAGCEPLPYGHQGQLMPSGSFWMDWVSMNTIAHWPMVPWKFEEYITDVFHENPKPVIIINPETFLLSEYKNIEETTNEKYPGIKGWLWKSAKLVQQCEGSYGIWTGKDCDSPDGYVSVDFTSPMLAGGMNKVLYASMPSADGGAGMSSEIFSEKISGLKLDFKEYWQMNALFQGTPYPLFAITRKPGAAQLSFADRFGSSFEDYGSTTIVYTWIGHGLNIVLFFIVLYMLFYGLTCVTYLNDVGDNFQKKDYI